MDVELCPQMALEKQLKEDIAGKMCTLKDQTGEVKKCTDDLVKKIKKLLGLFQNLLFSLLSNLLFLTHLKLSKSKDATGLWAA